MYRDTSEYCWAEVSSELTTIIGLIVSILARNWTAAKVPATVNYGKDDGWNVGGSLQRVISSYKSC